MNYNLTDRHLNVSEQQQLRNQLLRLTITYGPRNVTTALRKLRHYQSENRDEIPRVGQQRATKETAPCGTLAGYKRHINAKEPTCKECRKAKSEYNKEWRRGLR